MEIHIQNINEIAEKAVLFFNELNHRKVIALEGDMGVGKTTFIMNLLKALGIEELEGSPTYSLVNTYDSKAYGKIYHFDLYRLNNEEEAYDIGIEEMLYSNNLCFVEWPSKIKGLLPHDTVWLKFHLNTDLTRTITFDL